MIQKSLMYVRSHYRYRTVTDTAILILMDQLIQNVSKCTNFPFPLHRTVRTYPITSPRYISLSWFLSTTLTRPHVCTYLLSLSLYYVSSVLIKLLSSIFYCDDSKSNEKIILLNFWNLNISIITQFYETEFYHIVPDNKRKYCTYLSCLVVHELISMVEVVVLKHDHKLNHYTYML